MRLKILKYFLEKYNQHLKVVSIIFSIFLAISMINLYDIKGVKLSATMIFPLSAIWFSEELADYFDQNQRGFLDRLNSAFFLRLLGWCCLFSYLIIIIIAV